MGLSQAAPNTQSNPLYSTVVQRIAGKSVSLGDYAGKVRLVVNVASKCGLTPQYEGLDALYSRYKDRGLVVPGRSANNFKEQEPGTSDQIDAFCRSVCGVDFPIFGKLSVAGAGARHRLLPHGETP